MNIGVNFAFFEDKINFGVGLFSIQLLYGMLSEDKHNKYIIFVTDKVYENIKNKFKDFDVEIIPLKSKFTQSYYISKFYRLFFELPATVRGCKLDCYINLYTVWYNFVPKNIRNINVVHDLHFKYYPDFYSFIMLRIIKYRIKHILKKSSSIIAISEYVKKDVIEFCGDKCNAKISTIPNPVNVEVSDKGNRSKYILQVNSFMPWKNQITLLKAYSRLILQNRNFPYKLVLIGYGTADELNEYIQVNNLEDKVMVEQNISAAKLKFYYENARLFVNTSLFEGFGRGNIEAAMMMVPVLTTDVMCMREVSFDLFQYYSPATDDAVLAKKILECLEQDMDDKKLSYIKEKCQFEYNLQKVANQYIQVIDSI